MKRTLTLILFTLTAIITFAQKPADLNKAVFNIFTYDTNGQLITNAYGFFVGRDGDGIAPYQVFKGAARAEVINWQGQRAEVLRILGASATDDLVRFTTDIPTKKLISLITADAPAQRGQQLQLAFYTTDKKALPTPTNVTAADPYNGHTYYEITAPNEEQYFGCPILNAAGQAVAIVQKNVQKDATTACAIDVNCAMNLTNNSLSAINKELTAIHIAKQIPTTSEDDAFSYVYMMLRSQQDSALVITATEDLLTTYPNNAKILAERANFQVNHGNYAAADADLNRAIALGGESLSEIYNTQSNLMYINVLNGKGELWPAWTLDTALDAAQKAYSTQNLPIYLLQQANILTAQEKYDEALEKLQTVNASEIANHQTFFLAADILQRNGGEKADIIALLDSAIVRLPEPHTIEAAPYILAYADYLDNAGFSRRAALSYIEYEKLVGSSNLDANFYYVRMQAEQRSKLNQQALDDGATAIARAKTGEEKFGYLYAQATLQLLLGLYDDCIVTANEALKIVPNDPETTKVIGIAYGEKKQKSEATRYLKKALELGAQNVDSLIGKYK